MPTVLFVSASPMDQDRLRLSAEVRDIRHALQRSKNREDWKIESNEAITVDDLRRALLDFNPTVVHFSGHGGGSEGLCFEDADGRTHLTDGPALAKLFHHFKDTLKCVVLNACYSQVQGEVLQKEIDYVVGMRDAVDDTAASRFAVAFYDAVFAGTDFRTAFELGCSALDLNKLPDSDVPIFMTGSHLQETVLSYSAHIPEIERVLYTYFNTPFTERAKFTTTGDSLSSIINRYYRTDMHRPTKKVRVLSMKQLSDDQWCVELTGSQESRFMYVRIRDRSLQIEWEASVGLWSIPMKTYLATGPREPVVARVHAELASYYNYGFSEQKPFFQSVQLRSTSHESLYGYVKRGTDTYEKLMDILSDGNEHAITLEIRNVTDETSTVLIQKVLSPTWLYFPMNEAS